MACCRSALRTFLFAVLSLALCPFGVAQPSGKQQAPQATQRPLITQAVDETQLTVLKGNTHPWARPDFDLGTAPATLPMKRMLLVLKRSAEQEAALEKLLDDQQNKSSSSYHQWLTPDDYGKQFGPTDLDLQTISAWLQSHGFQVGSTRGRAVVEFSGSASQVQEAFHTSIHKYLVNGEQHWANASDPQIPTALTSAVAGVASLNNFPRRSMMASAGTFKRDKATGKISAVQPLYTFPMSCPEDNFVQGACFYGLGPYDFGTIYNTLPLWNSGINGTGQTIAIVGETNINVQDVRDFRTMFGLAANDPQIILNGPDPGLQADETEADLDVQWSGAIAPNATIDLVVSQSTETTAGIDLSAVYIVDNNLAGVMSESYGSCELALGTTGNQFYNALWQQAAAEGITVFISAGDNGAAGCDDFNAQPPAPAQYGLQVSGFASTPYNVAVGGTDFNDFTNPATYWNETNNSTTQASAKSYIPETTWNDSCTNAIFTAIGYSASAEANCNDSRLIDFVVPLGGSGGASACTTPSGSTTTTCAGGYAKPSWQTGTGVPADGKRDIPDVSLFASNGFLQSFYIVCQSDATQTSNCNLSSPYASFLGVGGTSASSPAFAAIMALVNQQTDSRQGNANYVLYKLAAKQSASSCNSTTGPASTCVFNDVTSGTNAMPCASYAPNCTISTAGDAYGVMTGYNAGTGYDLATGLGSVNANNLVTQWSSVTTLPSTTTLSNVSPTTITHGQAVSFSVAVKPQTGSGTPSGEISLVGGPNDQAFAGFNLAAGAITGSTETLPGGTYSLTAHYDGDGTYSPSDSSPVSVTVNKENSQPQVFLVTFDSNGNIVSGNTTTATYGSPYILRVNVENSAGQMCAPVSTSGETACPTGAVTMTDNGATLDAGTYTLNSYGYFEDVMVQLPGGTDSVKAAYAGDNSFNASSVTTPLIISRAPTGVNPPTVQSSSVGMPFTASALVQSDGTGVAPTGTVTFLLNGISVSGTTTYQGGTQTGPPAVAFLTANFTSTSSAFSKPGNYTITATYNGDGNYAPSIPSDTGITVQYPQPAVTLSPYQQTVPVGSTATLTALVDTSNKSYYPTGTIAFINQATGAVLAGPANCTSTKDSSGNYACQASGSFTATSETIVQAEYSGDNNYPLSDSTASDVFVPDFVLLANSSQVTVTQGQTQSLSIVISPLAGFAGTVSNFACSGLPAETTCSFSPQQVTPVNGQDVSTTLTITTTALGQSVNLGRTAKLGAWGLSGGMLLLGACFIVLPRSRKQGLPILLLMLAISISLPSCGGGSSGSSTGGGGGGNPTPSISSLTPSQVAAGSQVQSISINGAGFIAGSSVTLGGVGISGVTQSASEITIYPGNNQFASTGQLPVVVTNPTPGGGASGPVNFVVTTGTSTGTFTVTVSATSGALTHTAMFSLTVQ